MFNRCQWLNEPEVWSLQDGLLTMKTDKETDFWRGTYYGFNRHSGHAFLAEHSGDFTASLRVRGSYEALYDQAGIMVLVNEHNWVKAGVEHSDGVPSLGSVLTIGRSDWATGSFFGNSGDFYMRATVANGVLRIQVSQDGQHWPLVRLCPFTEAESYRVGPMACSPSRKGLMIQFSEFAVTSPSVKDLHDLS